MTSAIQHYLNRISYSNMEIVLLSRPETSSGLKSVSILYKYKVEGQYIDTFGESFFHRQAINGIERIKESLSLEEDSIELFISSKRINDIFETEDFNNPWLFELDVAVSSRHNLDTLLPAVLNMFVNLNEQIVDKDFFVDNETVFTNEHIYNSNIYFKRDDNFIQTVFLLRKNHEDFALIFDYNTLSDTEAFSFVTTIPENVVAIDYLNNVYSTVDHKMVFTTGQHSSAVSNKSDIELITLSYKVNNNNSLCIVIDTVFYEEKPLVDFDDVCYQLNTCLIQKAGY